MPASVTVASFLRKKVSVSVYSGLLKHFNGKFKNKGRFCRFLKVYFSVEHPYKGLYQPYHF
jgi:hypothetical protein